MTESKTVTIAEENINAAKEIYFNKLAQRDNGKGKVYRDVMGTEANAMAQIFKALGIEL